MHSFFSEEKVDINKIKLNYILNKLNVCVQACSGEFPPVANQPEEITILNSNVNKLNLDMQTFKAACANAVTVFEKIGGTFTIYFADDLSNWKPNEIADLSLFFAEFVHMRVELTVDAKQLSLLSPDKLQAFIKALEPLTEKLYLIRLANNSYYYADNNMVTHEYFSSPTLGQHFPRAATNRVYYPSLSKENMLANLMLATSKKRHTSVCEPSPRTNRAHSPRANQVQESSFNLNHFIKNRLYF